VSQKHRYNQWILHRDKGLRQSRDKRPRKLDIIHQFLGSVRVKLFIICSKYQRKKIRQTEEGLIMTQSQFHRNALDNVCKRKSQQIFFDSQPRSSSYGRTVTEVLLERAGILFEAYLQLNSNVYVSSFIFSPSLLAVNDLLQLYDEPELLKLNHPWAVHTRDQLQVRG
jgi:hypothetical protein